MMLAPRLLPQQFVLELTQRCNNSCLHCYTAWGAAELAYDRHGQGEMSTAEVFDIIARLREQSAVTGVALSGGEPLLRSDLADILNYLRDWGLASVLITNGTMLTPERVVATGAAGLYEIPLLSWRRETHNRMVGRAAWDSVVEGMANVKAAGGRMTTVFVATRLNSADLYDTVKLAFVLGATGLMYNRLNLGAYNMRYARQLLPTPAMLRENLDTLDDLAGVYGLPIAISVPIEPCVVDVRKYRHLGFGWCPLGGSGSYFTIDPLGNVRMCNHSPVVLGNLKRDCFVDLYTHPHVLAFGSTWPEECVDCPAELRELCRGGCRAAAEQCYGTMDRVDPFVTLSRASPQDVH
jgi:radical SAM protein with 4Fe4S-binding SPASM domain